MEKQRLDLLVFEKGLSESRERAKTDIMAGLVFVDGKRVDKPGTPVPRDAGIELRGRALAYVSRGGLKLEKALKSFSVSPVGMTCADCGASTGGFTDCLLQNGAAKVYAVDVGYGQLAWSIRNDPRVVVLERTNVRYLDHGKIPEALDLATADLSFISLKLVLPALRVLLKPAGQVLCLIKPQFEAGREKVGKKGVVREKSTHLEVLEAFLANAETADFSVLGLDFSPIRGPEGNIEYLGHLAAGRGLDHPQDLKQLVENSHKHMEGEEA